MNHKRAKKPEAGRVQSPHGTAVVPLVTVLMPCRDPKVSFFGEALGSVVGQTDSRWCLVVVDDHSRDEGILNVLDELSSIEDRRVSVVSNESEGISGALNTGMRHARTAFVCSLHCDDLLDPRAVECLGRYISDYPEVDYFHSARIYIDENGQPLSEVYHPRETLELSDFIDGPVKPLHCWRIRLALHLGGMDEALGLHGADDYDFSWCMAEAGCRFKAIPDCLYYVRDHRAHYRLTTHVPLSEQIASLKAIWKKHGVAEREMAAQLRSRRAGYLRQALFLDEQDRDAKQKSGYDIRQGRREKW